MRIRFLLGHAHGGGGAVRTTLNTAGALAAQGHDVEVGSVLRRWPEPLFTLPPGVRVTYLTTERPKAARLAARQSRQRLLARAVGRRRAGRLLDRVEGRLTQLTRSRLVPERDKIYPFSSVWTDVQVRRWVRAQRDGVLIGTNPGLNRIVAALARPSVVTVGTEHLNLGKRSREAKELLQPAYRRLDALVTLTEKDARAYRRFLGPGTEVRSVPNAVPPLPLAGADDHDRRVVLAAGRMTAQKGFDLLLDAWQQVAPQHPDWRLEIHGVGPEQRRLNRQVRRLDLRSSVVLPGFTTDLPVQMRRAGLFVLSSRYEGFPMVMLEAMGCGLPVVAFDCPTGPAEMVRTDVNGVLVLAGSVDALAAAIDRVLADDAARARMGREAETTAARYDAGSVARRWEDVLTELVVLKATPKAEPTPVP